MDKPQPASVEPRDADKPSAPKMPAGLTDILQKHNITGEVLAYACADLTNDGDLQATHLLLTDRALVFMRAVPGYTPVMLFSGAGVRRESIEEAEIGEVEALPLETLADPKILNQVAGGLLVVSSAEEGDAGGTERWLCRFSGARMRQMQKLVEAMEPLVKTKKKEDKKEETEGEESAGRGGRGRHGRGGGRRRRGGGDEEPCCPKCGMPYPEQGRAVCPKCMEKRVIFVRVLKYFSAYKLRVVVMLACVMASAGLNALWPYLSGRVFYNEVLGKNQEFAEKIGMTNVEGGGNFVLLLGLLLVAMIVTKILQQITGVIQGWMTAVMVPGVVAKVKNAVFEAMGRLSIGFFTRSQTGSLMQRVNGDANEVLHFFIDGLPYLLFNVFTVAMSAWIMFTIDWQLSVLSLAILPPLFFISYKLIPKIWHAHGRNARVNRALYSVLNDGLTGARVVKAFGQEESEVVRFGKVNDRVRDSEMRIVKYNNVFEITYRIALDIPVLLVWCAGAWFIIRSGGGFRFGDLQTFILYLAMLNGPITFFSQVFRWWAGSMNAAQRVFEIIDATPEIAEHPEAIKIELAGRVELKNVTFAYEPNKPVLKDITFDIQPGEMLGIIGKSGAGKSTLVNLISRLYEPQTGEILLDGVDIKEIAFSSLRGAVAMVSQETYIFIGTVAENIAYARPEATRAEIVRAAMAASAHAYICKLPDGYDTIIGAGGRQLSGGERQRLSIARAILANPRILVLDEATASVDTETERAIQDALDKLIKGRTTISIAHRLSTLRNADRLIVLENGKLVEEGTHAELIAERGVYFKLLQLQSKALAMRGIE